MKISTGTRAACVCVIATLLTSGCVNSHQHSPDPELTNDIPTSAGEEPVPEPSSPSRIFLTGPDLDHR